MKDTIAFCITKLYREFLVYTTEELKKLGLNFGQMPLILYAGKHPGCSQADLTKSLKLDWGYSQRSIVKLVNGGFIMKEYDRDEACNCLKLTPAGINAFDVCHRVFNSWDELKTENLNAEEKKTLMYLLKKIS
ncbi:MAG: bilirubin utilization transcriptional regulator BilQ [Candidatus Limivicinus sp.]|jgi:DNA-binding MarR family transcriptional regulator